MILFSKCKRCGRTLKDPVSQERGYGPICAEKVYQDESVQTDLLSFMGE